MQDKASSLVPIYMAEIRFYRHNKYLKLVFVTVWYITCFTKVSAGKGGCKGCDYIVVPVMKHKIYFVLGIRNFSAEIHVLGLN